MSVQIRLSGLFSNFSNEGKSLIRRSNFCHFFVLLQLLKRSEELCKASLEEDEDLEGEDVDRETGIIRVQLAYAIQMQVSASTLFCSTGLPLARTRWA